MQNRVCESCGEVIGFFAENKGDFFSSRDVWEKGAGTCSVCGNDLCQECGDWTFVKTKDTPAVYRKVCISCIRKIKKIT